MRISDWSSDVCSSDLVRRSRYRRHATRNGRSGGCQPLSVSPALSPKRSNRIGSRMSVSRVEVIRPPITTMASGLWISRSEEHTSELQSLMRISYAVFCLKKKKKHNTILQTNNLHL